MLETAHAFLSRVTQHEARGLKSAQIKNTKADGDNRAETGEVPKWYLRNDSRRKEVRSVSIHTQTLLGITMRRRELVLSADLALGEDAILSPSPVSSV